MAGSLAGPYPIPTSNRMSEAPAFSLAMGLRETSPDPSPPTYFPEHGLYLVNFLILRADGTFGTQWCLIYSIDGIRLVRYLVAHTPESRTWHDVYLTNAEKLLYICEVVPPNTYIRDEAVTLEFEVHLCTHLEDTLLQGLYYDVIELLRLKFVTGEGLPHKYERCKELWEKLELEAREAEQLYRRRRGGTWVPVRSTYESVVCSERTASCAIV